MDDLEILSFLLLDSHRGTIDGEEETIEQARAEMRVMFDGKYGPFIAEASFLIERDGRALSASLLTMWKGQPLLAFSMTRPEEKGRRLAGFLIERSLDALARAGHRELFLAVTDGNLPAQHLYRKLGFEVLGPA